MNALGAFCHNIESSAHILSPGVLSPSPCSGPGHCNGQQGRRAGHPLDNAEANVQIVGHPSFVLFFFTFSQGPRVRTPPPLGGKVVSHIDGHRPIRRRRVRHPTNRWVPSPVSPPPSSEGGGWPPASSPRRCAASWRCTAPSTRSPSAARGRLGRCGGGGRGQPAPSFQPVA